MMIRALRKAVSDLSESATNSENNVLVEVGESFQKQVDKYYGDDFYDHSSYRDAGYLDPRTVWALAGEENSRDLDLAVGEVKEMLFKSELELPPTIARSRNLLQPASNIITKLANNAKSASDAQKSAFDIEYLAYMTILSEIGEEKCMAFNPLEFWPTHRHKLPIHARLAATLLSAPATSSDCERLFSLSGRLFCKLRARLTAEHVNFRTCLNRWMNQKLDDEDQKAIAASQKRQKRSLRFATLSAKMEILVDPLSDDDEDESDDEE
jgi:hypothetical protein